MKKANYALFQYRSWLPSIGKTTLMMVFAWCFCLGIQEGHAQDAQDDFKLLFDSKKNTSTAYKLDECNGEVTSDDTRFVDDGSVDGNYDDSKMRSDTVEICPKSDDFAVQVVFTDFDLAIGDTLFVFDGNRKAVRAGLQPGTGSGATALAGGPMNGSGTGVGVFNAFGGWVDANCFKGINPSGCLTFVFQTNGDGNKGAGWDAWVDCQARRAVLSGGTATAPRLECDELSGDVDIMYPTYEACGDAGTGQIMVTIRDLASGSTCATAMGAPGDKISIPNLAIGQYQAIFKVVDDPDVTVTRNFAIQAKPLVANDNVTIPLGEACMIQLDIDDILESPCDTNGIAEFLHYEMTIDLGDGKNVLTTTVDTMNGQIITQLPVITKQNILDAGMSLCDATAEVTIERVYFRFNNNVPGVTTCLPREVRHTVRTRIDFEDISKPVINAPASSSIVIVGCDTTGLARILGVNATDNCDDTVPVTYTVSMDSDVCSSPRNITVNFTAIDDCGNRSDISRTYLIERPLVLGVNTTDPALDRLVKTEDQSEDCNDAIEMPIPGIEIGTRNITTGVVTVRDTVDLSTTEYVCGYILVKTEEEVPNTDCGSKMYEFFDLIDWCAAANANVRIDTTYLELTDKTAPEFQGEDGTITINKREFGTVPAATIPLGAQACTFDITSFDGPTAIDACSSVSVRIGAVARITNGNAVNLDAERFVELDCDSFRIEWIAEDACHEQLTNDTTYQIVDIRDVTAPSAVCQDAFNVSVPGDEGARLEIDDIDGGSSDACGITNREIRIKGSGAPWGQFVIIDCEDVHEEVQVELRITDKQGNTNICWTTVTAEDKIPPVCASLEDMSVTCTEVDTDELGTSTDTDGDGLMEDSEWVPLTGDLMEVYNTRFGTPVCEDNLTCGTLTMEQEYQLIEGECGQLMARRRYRASDWKPNTSSWEEQAITVTYVADWTLTFPADVELDCGDIFIPEPFAAADIIENGSCDIWAVEVTADTFEVGNDVCMKIERTYDVINVCNYTPGDPAIVIPNNVNGDTITSVGNETAGRYTYTQLVVMYVTEAPEVTINDVNTCIVGIGDAAPFYEEDQSLGTAPFECDTVRVFSASAINCVGAPVSSFEWKIFNGSVLLDEGDGASFPQVVQPGIEYTVEFIASDGCGNTGVSRKNFTFRDCKKPTPIALNGIAIELGEDGTVEIWAADLDQGSFDNCDDQKNLEYRLFVGGGAAGPTNVEDVLALGENARLNCNNVGTQTITFYVVDASGNYDFVETYVLVQANTTDCSGATTGGMVAGRIVNANGENVEQVAVNVTGAEQVSVTTGADGAFQFSLATEADYTVTPVKDMNPLNGVSTFDLVLISKHILGITPFDSPYKYIAADVNKSGSITAFDMVQLRQLILNINTEFTNNDSWRFVDAKHDFAASADSPAAQEFAEFTTINQLTADMMDVDFIGVKIGDVNGNAAANSLLGAETRSTNGTLNFNVTDRFVQAGETVTVDFRSAEIEAAQGYQFTMNLAGLNFNKLEEGVVKTANFNTNLADRGMITTSWNGAATANEVLFSMTFEATTSGLLSELVSLSSDVTMAEAYNTDGDLLDVNIEFAADQTVAEFALGQNTPNPFNGETVIAFNLPEAGTATLTVMNIQGKVLTEIKGDYAKGYNNIVLKASDLGATGVLHYQLESADNVATKKMIIIE